MTTIKSSKKTNTTPKTLALTAMFAAIITVSTMFIKISIPLGYVHAGDSMVYLGACVLPAPFNFIAAALGGALADLLSGYAHFCLPTAIIKALNVLPFFIAAQAAKKKGQSLGIISLTNLLMLIPASIVTVGGYFLANTLLYNAASAAADVPAELVQAVVGAVIFTAAGLALDKIHFKSRIF